MVFTDMTAEDELLTILPMKKCMHEEDIFHSFQNFEKTQLHVCKLVAPLMLNLQWLAARMDSLQKAGMMTFYQTSLITTA